MKITIIIPAYNAEKFIETCIKSIYVSNYKDVETIIVNDGATDNTKTICEKLSNKYNNIKIINNSNNGVSFSRNIGIENASNEYIMFVDSDDMLTSNWHNIVFEEIKNNKNDIIYFSSNLTKELTKEQLLLILSGYENLNFAGPFSKVYKKAFLLSNKITFDTEVINGEDILFNMESLLKVNEYKNVTKSFYMYRVYCGSATKSFNNRLFKSDKKFQLRAKHIINSSDLKDVNKINILNYYKYNAILTFFDRLSYLKNYVHVKKNLLILKDDCYQFKKNEKISSKFSMKNKFVLFLIRKKWYCVVYFIYKLYHLKNGKTIENYIKI